MNKLKLLPILNTVLLIVGLCVLLFHIFNQEKNMVYVDNVRLFNEFNMTKEVKAAEEIKLKKTQIQLDSLIGLYNLVADKESIEFKKLQYQIELKNRSLQELQNNYSNNLTQQVWVRLNGYLNTYGETNNIEFIFGSNHDSGNVMYVNSKFDQTQEILTYVNQKYEGN